MFSTFSSFSSVQNTYIKPAIATDIISAISGIAYAKDTSPYTVSGKTVYSFTSTIAQPTTCAVAQNKTGTFTITVKNSSKTIYYIIVAGGGGGGCGNGDGGGGSGGEVKYGSVTLQVGTYICSCEIGGGGGGGEYKQAYINTNPGADGNGFLGGISTLTINGTIYSTIGGSAGAPYGLSNKISPAGAYGGGSSGNGGASTTGSKGEVQFKGGDSPILNTGVQCLTMSGGGGGGAGGNGGNGTQNTLNAVMNFENNHLCAISGPGGVGGNGISSAAFSIPELQFTNPQYFSAGGGGGVTAFFGFPSYSGISGNIGINATQSTNNIGGKGGGAGRGQDVTILCTSGVNHTGSGGGAGGSPNDGFRLLYTPGDPEPRSVGAGGNGIIILSF